MADANVATPAPAKVVDSYELEIVERDSFKFVHIKFLCADGTIDKFEFVPPYAYALSDELVKTAAHAAAK